MAERGARLLVVDDNKVTRLLLMRSVELLGHRVASAENGLIALELLRAEPFDLVLLDMEMPEMDGLEASRRINARWKADERPRIVAMTANAMQGDREECLAAGMDDYVTKPIAIDRLVEALSNANQRKDR